MQELHDELAQMDDAEILLVHASDRYGRYESAQALLDDGDFTMPVIERGRSLAVEYQVKGFPTMVVLDKDGTVVYKKLTPIKNDRQRRDLLKRIEGLRVE